MIRSRSVVAAFSFLFLAPVVLCAQVLPSFLIERIEVRGAHFASKSVVARESLLIPGRMYSEPQLRDAMSHINRLPFVLDSSFALEKGTERGAYVLVVTIVETKPLFAEASSMFATSSDNNRFTDDNHISNGEFIRSGARWFLGSSTLLHASTDFHENYEAGLTQYNLFGRPGYVTLNVRWPSTGESNRTFIIDGQTFRNTVKVDPSPELLVGFPLFGNHSIQGRCSYAFSNQRLRKGEDVIEDNSVRGQGCGLAWVWDTTDDPILPIRGSLWRTEGTLSLSRTDATVGTLPDNSRQIQDIVTSFHHYHPLSERMSVMVGGTFVGTRFDFGPEGRDTRWSISPEAGLTISAWSEQLTRKLGDLRWETRASYFKPWGGMAQGFGGSFDSSLSASTGLVQRSVWGTLRLGFTYSYAKYNNTTGFP